MNNSELVFFFLSSYFDQKAFRKQSRKISDNKILFIGAETYDFCPMKLSLVSMKSSELLPHFRFYREKT